MSDTLDKLVRDRRQVRVRIRALFKLALFIIAGSALIEGYCPKCGIYRVGWALLNPRHQTCPECGAGLKITQNGRPVTTGYSPFQAEKYVIKPPDNVIEPDERGEDAHIKKD